MKRTGKHHAERIRDDVCDFEVIGELKANPGQLLLRGCDGRFYAMDPAESRLWPVKADDSWAMDLSEQTSWHVELPSEVLV